jgi:hypothetical protein
MGSRWDRASCIAGVADQALSSQSRPQDRHA